MIMQIPLTATALIIDNDAALRLNIKNYFEDAGFTIIEAENGQIGLKRFAEEKPDIVVTDLQMPVLNGLEVLKVLTKEFPETPVVVVSESGGLEEVIQALRIGAWDYLTKPISQLPVLEHAVCRALERSRLIQENRIYRRELELANQALKKNLEILQADQEAGRSVQMRLLPEPQVCFGGYCFSHRINPSLFLSGDFVDYFKINDKEFAFYIADVSGHGSSSAFVTVLLKSIMAQILTYYQVNNDQMITAPDQVMSKLADEIHFAKLGKYLTMVYGVVNSETHEFTYSVGGHYPNPVILENGKARFLEGRGFPVGIMKNTKYPVYKMLLQKEMRLMLFSDGIAEILPEKEMAAKDKLLLSMVEKGKGTIEYIVQELDLQDQKALPDDVTLMALSRED
jgi:sigma-B regulation protein RsbU (phosphoserine phosphatase)